MSERNNNGFRMSDGFIERWTRVLAVSVVAVPVLGIALGFASDGDWAPSWLGDAAVVIIAVGVVVPLLLAAVMGGEAITRGGGLIGALLTFGIVALVAGSGLDRPGWATAGTVALVVSAPGFVWIGWRAGVPMTFLGIPVRNRRPPG